MEKLCRKLIICMKYYFFSNLISFSYKLEMQDLSWPFQFPNYSHFQIFTESASHKRNAKSQFSVVLYVKNL